jgi:hypothetical protein
MDEPVAPATVKKLVLVAISAAGKLGFSGHARVEMANDDLTEVDVVNVLRGGKPHPGEFENGSWRYKVSTSRIEVVVTFRSVTWAVVVTAWRRKR